MAQENEQMMAQQGMPQEGAPMPADQAGAPSPEQLADAQAEEQMARMQQIACNTVSAGLKLSAWRRQGKALDRPMRSVEGPPGARHAHGASQYLQGPMGEEGELSEVTRLKARLKRQRDANRRLEQKLSQAEQQGFGKEYGAQLRQTEQRVAERPIACRFAK